MVIAAQSLLGAYLGLSALIGVISPVRLYSNASSEVPLYRLANYTLVYGIFMCMYCAVQASSWASC